MPCVSLASTVIITSFAFLSPHSSKLALHNCRETEKVVFKNREHKAACSGLWGANGGLEHVRRKQKDGLITVHASALMTDISYLSLFITAQCNEATSANIYSITQATVTSNSFYFFMQLLYRIYD